MPKYRAIAEYYDAEYEHQAILKEDVPFFLGQVQNKRQTILELAVGTGRAAIPMAQAGHRVMGIDYDRQMLEIARRKRNAVGLSEKQLELARGDVISMELGRKFDWVCVFFNTFLIFSTLEKQDQAMAAVRRHLKPKGRFFIDVFQPDLKLLSREHSKDLEPAMFYVPRFDRTVYRSTEIRVDPSRQVQRVMFHYLWFDENGVEKREKVEFDMTFLFPRELRMLVERNGMEIEEMWGNYDGSRVDADSPRMIARCRLV